MATKPSKLTHYFYHVIIGLDQFINALTGGCADETISSRCYRGAILDPHPKKRWRVMYRLINGLFFDKHHCQTAYQSELNRKQYPATFRQGRDNE